MGSQNSLKKKSLITPLLEDDNKDVDTHDAKTDAARKDADSPTTTYMIWARLKVLGDKDYTPALEAFASLVKAVEHKQVIVRYAQQALQNFMYTCEDNSYFKNNDASDSVKEIKDITQVIKDEVKSQEDIMLMVETFEFL